MRWAWSARWSGCKQSFGLQLALQTAAAEMPVPVAPQVLTDVLGFIRDRLYRVAARPGAGRTTWSPRCWPSAATIRTWPPPPRATWPR